MKKVICLSAFEYAEFQMGLDEAESEVKDTLKEYVEELQAWEDEAESVMENIADSE